MQDQQKMWDDAHAKHQLHTHALKQTSFAEEVNKFIPKNSSILELGCGEGNDSLYFAQQGHTVTATDFSDVIISNNSQDLLHPRLQFKAQDINKTLNFPAHSFSVIYARLSLHYFKDSETQKVFAELARMLMPNGYLCFMCKSVDDLLYGQGSKIEKDMFELNGHVRHFFSEDYARQLLKNNHFKVLSFAKGKDKLYQRESAFIKVIAQREG